MSDAIGIKVAIRCRPWTTDSTLGIYLNQVDDESGEIELKNATYTRNRFGFTWCWWTGHGSSRYCQEDEMHNERLCDQMKMISQKDVYDACGLKIKNDLLGGDAVVMFAYGLSGSGKTFTVFGPDAVDSPDAWFKFEEPTGLWGLFPRLGYEICNEKQDGWVLRMKYFQNVVDTVRDLMTPTASEQSYKAGMRKDQDGFMDIDWCKSAVIPSWDDLRKTFMDANSRKAIAPTQFNHQSTRGHCIMTLELEKPHPDNPEMKQIGRLYVCDLAGTEPAGDIVYAEYKKEMYEENGKTQIDYKYIGPHKDASKSKELQDQGKKINLSLSEMAQFFMKMAEAIKKKTLKPGKSIPGCNSYFLCKFLKDTMLQAKTYLFCAVRPESKYLSYTYSTLNFAKNASVIKLEPKKSTAGMSANEIKLMKELEEMKKLVEELRKSNQGSSSGGQAATQEQAAMMMTALESKQAELAAVLEGGSDGNSAADEAAERQKAEYGARGISLTVYAKDTEEPYFVNLDRDPYRSNRHMYVLTKESMTFGSGGDGAAADFQPMTFGVVDGHCTLVKSGEKPNQVVKVVGGNGPVHINGKVLKKGEEKQLKWFDRVAVGNEMLMFRHPGVEPADATDEPTPEMAFLEFNEAVAQETAGLDEAALAKAAEEANQKHEEEMKKMEAEKASQMEAMQQEYARQMEEMKKEMAEKQAAELAAAQNSAQKEGALKAAEAAKKEAEAEMAKREEEMKKKMEQEKMAMNAEFDKQREIKEAAKMNTAAVEADIRELIPKIKDLEVICAYLDRGFLGFEVTLQGKPELQVKVKVKNHLSDDEITLEKFTFASAYSVIKDNVSSLQQAVLNNREYTFDEANDPVRLFFDNNVEMGVATSFLMGLAYNIGTDDREQHHELKRLVPPFDQIGSLDVKWIPIVSPTDESENVPDVDDPCEFIGKPWAVKLQVIGAVDLPVRAATAYVSYEFNGETYTSMTVEPKSRSPKFEYEFIHIVSNCDAAFVNYLENGVVHFTVNLSPVVAESGKPAISSTEETINKNMKAMVENQKATAGGTYANVTVTHSGVMPAMTDKEAEATYKARIADLEGKLAASEDACKALQSHVKTLEAEIKGGGGGSGGRMNVENEAKSIFNMMDTDKSGSLSPLELSYQLSDLGFPENEIEALFLRMDLNRDGKIELDEFVKNFAFYQAHLANYSN